MEKSTNVVHYEPWNKGKIVGQKAPFKVKDIWALRVRLQMEGRVRELALFNLGIDSKLRGCDLVSPKVRDVTHGRSGGQPSHRHATQDQASSAIRDHGCHQRGLASMDQAGGIEIRRLSFSQQTPRFTPPRNSAVRSDSWALGG